MRNSFNMRHLVILIYLLCTACGTALPSVKPFKLDVQQGNVVTSKMLLQLRPGMTKSQVRFIMGSPLIQDSFHGNRWDYAYQLRENGKLKEQRRVILDFENDVLKTVRGDVVPAGSEAAKALQAEADAAAAITKKEEEKSMVDKLKFWDKSDEAKPSSATPAGASEPKMVKGAIVNSQVAAPEALLANQADVASEHTTNAPIAAVDNTNEVLANDQPSILVVPLVDAPVVAETSQITPQQVAPKVDPAMENLAATPALSEAQSATNIEPAIRAESSASDVATTNLSTAASVPTTQKAAPGVALVPATVQPVSEVPTKPSMPTQEGLPFNNTTYESEAGMIFDRSLKMTPLDDATIAAQFAAAEAESAKTPDSGIPAPKPLPAESEPGFFDRMLERIGF